MAYKIKSKNKEINTRARELHLNFIELNDKAQEIYGTDFNKLSWKEQNQISKKVAKGFHWKVH
jgi:hypothetical protein